MENNDYFQNYKNYSYQNQMNQVNRNLSPNKENKINQSILYQNRDTQNIQNGNYYNNNQFPFYSTPKKASNLFETDSLLSPIESNSKNDITNNNLLTNKKNNFLNVITTPFKSIIGNSPYNGIKSENKL